MAKYLIHVTCGVENPSKAALAFLVAKSAFDEKHQVRMFLAGDAAQLPRPAVIEDLSGLGTGSLKAHIDAIQGGGKFYVSGMSAKSRGFEGSELGGFPPSLPCQMYWCGWRLSLTSCCVIEASERSVFRDLRHVEMQGGPWFSPSNQNSQFPEIRSRF